MQYNKFFANKRFHSGTNEFYLIIYDKKL